METNMIHLCGKDFLIWKNGAFGSCFHKVALSFPSFALMSVICAYYAGKTQTTFIRNRFSLMLIRLRIIFVLFLLAISLAKPIFLKFYANENIYIIDYAQLFWCSLGWCLHLLYLSKLQNSISRNPQGIKAVNIMLLLIMISELLHFWSSLKLDFPLGDKIYSQITNCGSVAFILCYIITIIPTGVMADYYGHPIVNDEAEDYMYAHGKSYGTFYERENWYDLGVAEDEHNLFSKLTFWWVRKLMAKGSKGLIKTESDLYDLPNALKTETISCQIKAFCQTSTFDLMHSVEELRNLESDFGAVTFHQRKPYLIYILNKCFGWEFYSIGVLRFLGDASTFAGPVLLNLLVTYLETKSEPVQNGYYYSIGLFCVTLLAAFFNTHFNYLTSRVGMKVRAAMIHLIYQKTLSVNSSTLSVFNTGEIVNFMSTDTDRIVNFCQSFHQFWSLPFQILIALYLLHQQIGLSFLAGFGFAVLLIPLNRWLANKIASLSTERLDRKDKRIKLMNELLNGIRVVKMHAWEDRFAWNVSSIRGEELTFLKSRKYLDALCVYFWATSPVLISVLTFTMYVLLGNTLTAAKVFTCLSLFNVLITPLNAFPWVINGIVEAWVSIKRVQRFVLLKDLDHQDYYAQMTNSSNDVEILNGQFSWQDEVEEDGSFLFSNDRGFLLGPLNVNIEKGQLLGITGSVGSGKSSFLSAILAELYRKRGTIVLDNMSPAGTSSSRASSAVFSMGIGYVAQEPWIQNATIQQNILFGKPFNVFRYNHVLEACALLNDLELFPSGDQTEVGERGVTLSGGQKSRLSLARAIYQDFNIYLLDDPFSAVDIHVAEYIYRHCLRGLLQNKTVVLCTHHLRFLKDAQHVIILKDGRPIEEGYPSDVLPTNLPSLMKSEITSPDPIDCQEMETSVDFQPKLEDNLIQEEEREIGTLKWDVYKAYARVVGLPVTLFVLMSLFLMQGSKISSDWWLAYWVSDINPSYSNRSSLFIDDAFNKSSSHDVKFYLFVFGGLAVSNSLFTLIRAFAFAYGGIQAAIKVHDFLLGTIMKAPIRFFDVTPLGRILNRFSSDLNMVDDSLPFILNIFLSQLYGLVGSLIITCYGLPWMIVMLLPLAFVYLKIQNYYRHTSRDLKRLYSTTLSPLYAHFTETLSGLTTIRAMAATGRFARENEEKFEVNQQASFASICASQWLNLHLQMIGVSVVTSVSFLAVVQHHISSIDPGLVGLAVSYALSVTSLLNGVVSSFTETEKEMVSVERVVQYLQGVESEKKMGILAAPVGWPVYGVINFCRVNLRYQPSFPLALVGVSLETKPGEKVGIVGRTGSGKSSLFQALFRIVELEEGEICIDGVNIAHIDLQCLRSNLAIIPQDPFLFSGTIKSNLDPEGSFTELELWKVLRQCHMRNAVLQLGGLEATVAEHGQQFSVGQKQLLCLARALLVRTKIICIDEATASVDFETDQAIQQTIRSAFVHTTVLTIAHRVETVSHCDRVLIMSSGALVESGKPQALLNNPLSYFSTYSHTNKTTG